MGDVFAREGGETDMGGSEAKVTIFGQIGAVSPDLCIKTSYGRGLCLSEGSNLT
jgi:hypothetical protein